MSRPPVAIVVPFFGDAHDARELAHALDRVRLEPGDQLVVSDNTPEGVYARVVGRHVVRAPLERSSYYARNVGVEATSAPWILFLDSDCRPAPDIVARYFDEPPADDAGLVSGAVVAAEGQEALIARYARSRGHIDPEHYKRDDRRHAGITANLLVRRVAWEAVGGFHEGLRSGADVEFCWRVQDAGWGFAWRPGARTEHEHVETLRAMARKARRHAGGGGWVNRRYPRAFARPELGKGLARAAAGVPVWLVALQPRRALFKALDGVFLLCDASGRLTSNAAARDATAPDPRGARVLLLDSFADAEAPDVLDAVTALAAEGPLRIEARTRPWRPERGPRRALHTSFLEDTGVPAQLRDLLAVVARRPLALRHASLRLAPAARRLRERGDVQVLALAGDPAAPAARQLARLAGVPFAQAAAVAPRPPAPTRSAFVSPPAAAAAAPATTG